MLLYSVTVYIDSELEDDWYAWMVGKHIPDVLRTGHFQSAGLSRILEPESAEPGYRIEYRCLDAAAYRAYQAEDAPALQAEHTERYAGRFKAARQLLAERDVLEADGLPA